MPRAKDPAVGLAEKLVQVLEAQRGLGSPPHPLTLRRIGQLADPAASPEQLVKATGKKLFRDRALLAQKKSLDTPVALVEDLNQLAESTLLLEFVLDTVCSTSKPTVPPTGLKTKVDVKLRQSFFEAVQRRMGTNALPP